MTLSHMLSRDIAIECDKIAFDNGYKHSVGEQNGWRKYKSNNVSGSIWLTVDKQRLWMIALENESVVHQINLDRSTQLSPGYACFEVESEESCSKFLDRVYKLSKKSSTDLESRYLNDTAHLTDETEVDRQHKQRIGQDLLRKELLLIHSNRCELTGIDNPELLRASHIKPWATCSSRKERLNVNNCLLLSALWDAAFDEGFVTIDKSGFPVFSKVLTQNSINSLVWKTRINIEPSRQKFLDWHRRHVFKETVS